MPILTSLIAISILPSQATPISQPTFNANNAWLMVSQMISQRYYARTSRNAEMQSILNKYADQAKAAKDEEAFASVMDRMIPEFGDSHFDFLTREDQGFYVFNQLMGDLLNREVAQLANIGAWFEPAEQGFRVKMVLNGSEAEKKGLRKGDMILSADGAPFQPVSSFAKKENVTLKVMRGDDEMTVQVSPVNQGAIDMFYDGTIRSAKVIEREGKRFAYLRVWTMIDKKFHEFMSNYALRGVGSGTDGFIYDLRDGFGGRPEGFYEPFFAPSYKIEWDFGGAKSNQITGYSNPLCVLTNEGTRSAKEVVSAVFKQSGRAYLIGRPTSGDVLGTSPIPIGDWAFLEIPMVNLHFEGQQLEKNPVQPDKLMEREFDAQGHDLVIEEAIQHLLSKAK